MGVRKMSSTCRHCKNVGNWQGNACKTCVYNPDWANNFESKDGYDEQGMKEYKQ